MSFILQYCCYKYIIHITLLLLQRCRSYYNIVAATASLILRYCCYNGDAYITVLLLQQCRSYYSIVPIKASIILQFVAMMALLILQYCCYRYVKNVNVRSYIARYPVLGIVQSLLQFTPCRPVHINAISTPLGSIQPRCNYCAKNFRSNIHISL